jgi:biotin carboxyl carrier protein
MKFFFQHQDSDELHKELTLKQYRKLDANLSHYQFITDHDKILDLYVAKRGERAFLSYDQKTWRPIKPKKHFQKNISGAESWNFFAGFLPKKIGDQGGDGLVTKMPGKVVLLKVKVGDAVEKGQTLVIFEAMKMEQELKSPKSGIVAKIHVVAGQAVDQGTHLLEIEE